ncbi:hypothetical protein [Streptomyces sp. WM6372]|uniref:hypothetical protein n=1 Tax=Streptomyces sp. WM6372 TaxID=1415555 RepID=UPI001F37AB3E|nr:hypothetical protein [Streptomyces sp. WM6372]
MVEDQAAGDPRAFGDAVRGEVRLALVEQGQHRIRDLHAGLAGALGAAVRESSL